MDDPRPDYSGECIFAGTDSNGSVWMARSGIYIDSDLIVIYRDGGDVAANEDIEWVRGYLRDRGVDVDRTED